MKKIAVIKYGGHAFEDKNSIDILTSNVKELERNNYAVIIVHGGTPAIGKKLQKLGIESEMVDGIRITTNEIVDIVQEVILGKETVDIVKLLNKNDISALGLNGIDCNLLKCEKLIHKNGQDYGFVGNVTNVNTNLLKSLIEKGVVPVIAPIGVDHNEQSYNLNSDPLSVKVAISMNADLFFMVTNIDGVREDVNDSSKRIKVIDSSLADTLIKEGVIKGPMLTKLEACLEYANKTNRVAYIINSDKLIDYDLVSTNNFGTKVVRDSSQDFCIRIARIEDIEDISRVIKRSFTDYQKKIEYKASPLSEKYEDVVLDILNKYVFVGIKDNKIISSSRLNICDNFARIIRICVDPDYYNKGYGSMMLEYVSEYAAGKGVTVLGLTTIGDAEDLKHFYEKNGFKKKYLSYNRGYEKALMIKDISNTENIDINWFLN